jgi:hypothetical protein
MVQKIMKIVEVRQGQTLADIAIKEYGCYEGISLLLNDNSGLSVDVDLVPGTLLKVNEVVPELTSNNIVIANLFKKQQVNPNSGYLITNNNGFYNNSFYNNSFYE